MRSLFAALALVSLAAFPAGCSGGAETADLNGGEEEGALGRALLANVAAVQVETTTPGVQRVDGQTTKHTVTIGADAKVAKLMRGLKKRTARDPIPLCHPGSTRTALKFFDDKGNEIAAGGYTCRMGQIDKADGTSIQIVLRDDAVADVLSAPLVPKDALWGIDKIEIKKLQRVGTAPVGTAKVEGAGIAKVLAAMDIEQDIDPSYQGTRCLPTHTIGFQRKGTEVAYSIYVCHLSSPIPTELKSAFTIASLDGGEDDEPLARGGIKINPRAIEDVYASSL